MSAKRRLYNEEYIKYGFTFIEKDSVQLPQCVVCHNVLSNDSLRPVRLERHLTTSHPALKNKPKEFFIGKRNSLNRMKLDSTGTFQQENEKVIEASYEVSLLIAKDKKPHTIGETLIKPSILKATRIVLGEESQRKMDKIPLSNNSVQRRIDEMALNVKEQLVKRLKMSPFFALQCDDSTDIAQQCQLIVYCRFVDENKIIEELLFSKNLETTSKGSDVFSAINDFLVENDLSWDRVMGICTDGAPAMLGSRSGFISIAKEKNPALIGSHCMIHRQALASKTLPEKLNIALKVAIRVVNLIKSSAVNTRLFRVLCNDLSAEHQSLIFHTQVRWLSKGNMLSRLYELKSEVELFLLSQGKDELHHSFTDDSFLFSLAYLADFFETLNNLNLKLQGKNSTIMDATDAIRAFLEKTQLWKRRLDAPITNFSSFPRFNELLDRQQYDVNEWRVIISAHLGLLQDEFKLYFPDLSSEDWQCKLARSPFTIDVHALPDEIQEDAIELKCDSSAKEQFQQMGLEEFWASFLPIYPRVAKEALKVLIQFSSTYLCETGFSTLAIIKTKHRSRLNVESDLRCALTSLTPNIKELLKEKQFQPSH